MKKVSVSLLVYNEKHNLEETISKAYKELEKLKEMSKNQLEKKDIKPLPSK